MERAGGMEMSRPKTITTEIEALHMWPSLFGNLRRWFGAKRDMETTEKEHAATWARRDRENTRERKLMHSIAQYLQMAEKQGVIQWNGLRHHNSPDDPTSEEELEEWFEKERRRRERQAVLDEMDARQRRYNQQAHENHLAWLEATKEERAEKARIDVARRLAHREACRERARLRKEQKAKQAAQ